MLPNFRVVFLILSVTKLINFNKLSAPPFLFLIGKVYFSIWQLLNVIVGVMTFYKEKTQFSCNSTETGNYCWKWYIILGVRWDMLRSFLITTFMKLDKKDWQTVFAQSCAICNLCPMNITFHKAANPETKNSGWKNGSQF